MITLTDFNGVWCDSLPAVSRAVNNIRSRLGLCPLTIEEVRATFGHGVHGIHQATLPSTVLVGHLIEEFIACYEAAPKLFHGARDALDHLNGNLVVLSNAPESIVRRMIDAASIREAFREIIGDAGKPEPTALSRVIERYRADRSQIVLIGDQAVDFLAARGAGIRSIGCGWGYGNAAGTAAPDRWVHSFDELVNAIGEMTHCSRRDAERSRAYKLHSGRRVVLDRKPG